MKKENTKQEPLDKAENLIQSVENRLRDEARVNRERIKQEREQEFRDSGIIEYAREARDNLAAIEKNIAANQAFFDRANKLDLRALPGCTGIEFDDIARAIREFRMAAGMPHTLREGLGKFEQLQADYAGMSDANDRRFAIAKTRALFAGRSAYNNAATIARCRDKIENALREVDKHAQYHRERFPDAPVTVRTSSSVNILPASGPTIEKDFDPAR